MFCSGIPCVGAQGGRERFIQDRERWKMKSTYKVWLAVAALVVLPWQARAAILLGTAGNYAVLGGSTVTNTGPTVINGGNVGVSPGSAITGFPPGSVAPPYTLHGADAEAEQAQNDLTVAYNAAVGLPNTQDLTGQDLGGMTLLPGVYAFSTSAQLTGMLTLNNLGDPDAEFVFKIGSTLTTASNSSVVTINGGADGGCGVIWQVGSSATLGTGTAFAGHILAQDSITLTTGASILNGSALARTGAVTLDDNNIRGCATGGETIPEPATLGVMVLGGALLLGRRSRRMG